VSAEPPEPKPSAEIPVLVGKRVSLQPFQEGDLPSMVTWPNDERTRRWSRQTFPQTPENQKKIVTDNVEFGTKSPGIQFAIWLNDEKRAIGFIGLNGIDWANRNCWIGATIGDKAWWGQGIAGEVGRLIFDYAFGELGLHKINTGIFSPNARSLGAASKFLTQAGVQREEIFVEGKYIDANVFEIFDRDWMAMRAQASE
jgi:RimJ/RimL family protein N-acetyltransferase